MKKSFVILSFIIALSFFVQATTLEEECQYYLNGGESISYKSFSYKNSSYLMVKINGKEALVFKQEGSSFSLIQSVDGSDLLNELVGEYIKSESLNTMNPEAVNSINESFFKLNQTLYGVCLNGIASFLRSLAYNPQGYIMTTIKNSPTLGYAVYQQVLNARKSINYTYLELIDSVAKLRESISLLSESHAKNDLARIHQLSKEINTEVSRIKPLYENFSSPMKNILYVGTSKLLPDAFTYLGVKYTCSQNQDIDSSINSIYSNTLQLISLNYSNIFSSVEKETKARASSGALRKAFSERKKKLEEAQNRLKEVYFSFLQVKPIDLNGLNSSLSKATQTLSLLNNASKNSLNQLCNQFDKELEEGLAVIEEHAKTLVFFNQTIYSLNLLDNAIKVARQKFGEADSRISEIQSIQKQLLTQEELLEQKLTSGNIPSSQEFEKIKNQSKEVYERTKAMKEKSAEVDWPTILGIIVLVCAVIGFLFYLSKTKPVGEKKVIDIKEMEKKELEATKRIEKISPVQEKAQERKEQPLAQQPVEKKKFDLSFIDKITKKDQSSSVSSDSSEKPKQEPPKKPNSSEPGAYTPDL